MDWRDTLSQQFQFAAANAIQETCSAVKVIRGDGEKWVWGGEIGELIFTGFVHYCQGIIAIAVACSGTEGHSEGERKRGRRTFQAKEGRLLLLLLLLLQLATALLLLLGECDRSEHHWKAIAQQYFTLCGGNVDGRQLKEWGINRHRRHKCPRIYRG